MAQRIPKPVFAFFGAMLILMGSVAGITWLLETRGLSPPARLALALLPPAIWVCAMAFLLRAIRLLDELQRRIHLEALATAFPSVAVAVLVCEYLGKAGFISYLLPDHVLVIMMASLLLAYVIAWRRYS